MQASHQTSAGQVATETATPLVEIFDDLVPANLHAAAWAACSGKGWYFGHGSNTKGWARFWKLDLDGAPAFDAIWEKVQPRCEALAGTRLRVIRQYANGHTYGLGGDPHLDDHRPGTFTLLYYPNPEWKDGWEGETVFYDAAGEIALSVRLRPNRAVFFDSRILHHGRAPSRICTAVRVSVAFKLEAVQGPVHSRPRKADANRTLIKVAEPGKVEEIERDGAKRVYRMRVAEDEIQKAVTERLTELSKSVRLPGFPAGGIPLNVMEERYGRQARAAILKRFGARMITTGLPAGSVASVCRLVAGEDCGDLECIIDATHLPDLHGIDFLDLNAERLQVADADLTPEVSLYLRENLKSQILDQLDAAYSVPLFPPVIEREFAAIWKLAETHGEIPTDPEDRSQMEAGFRRIAERRLRLGVVVAELARRFEIHADSGPEMEERVIDHLLDHTRIVERPVTREELRNLMAG